MSLPDLYRPSLSLLTDLYQLTMAYGYWKNGLSEREATFHLTFRENPFSGGFAVACGLSLVVDWLQELCFAEEDLEYLRTLTGNDHRTLFEPAFLDYLGRLKFSCDVDATPEGTVVFPHEPLVRVRGPILQGQIIETGLLTLVNFQTLVATKAARVCAAAGGEPVLEFGLRRAQGIDGGLSASRAAFIGGCAATSNVLAGKLFGIPVRGTHAHSWVMAFDDELESFRKYADAMPNNCVFLVDTFDTLVGVKRAIEVGRRLRQRGFELVGIRLDSGDLAELSIAARKMLDDAGFDEAAIVASNDLDEYEIGKLKQAGATINIWGVGTRLATAYDQPALGGVYKLGALKDESGTWDYKIKLSNEAIKVSNPGVQQVRRFSNESGFCCDAIYNETVGIADEPILVDQQTGDEFRPRQASHTDLLVPVFRKGKSVYTPPQASGARQTTQQQLAMLPEDTKSLSDPAAYQIGLESRLHQLKQQLMTAARGDGR